MASISKPRLNKDGTVSYIIRVYHGCDSSGRKLKPYTETYRSKPGMSEKQIAKELNRVAVKFEEQCKQGFQLDNRQTFAEYVIQLKERSGVKHNTIYTSIGN